MIQVLIEDLRNIKVTAKKCFLNSPFIFKSFTGHFFYFRANE